MPLVNLQVERFRCLERVNVDLDASYNLFVGPNASGKTSLLEALFFLGRGRSFRTRRLDRLIQHGEHDFLLVGRIEHGNLPVVLGVRGSRQGTEVRVGGAAAGGAADLAAHFAPQVIDPEIHKLLEEGPARRRRYLDWGVFHVEHGFMPVWQRYHRALRQRNAALKQAVTGASGGADARLATAWNAELAQAGEALADLRRRYVELLGPDLAAIGRRLLERDVTVAYQPGWAGDEALGSVLERGWERDRRYGLTHAGPHRADITVRVDGHAARDRVSRGQQKLLAAALTLAQLGVQERISPGRGALLLDDPAAELDADNLERLLAVVRQLPVQLFVTSLRADVPGLGAPGGRFGVEGGRVTSS